MLDALTFVKGAVARKDFVPALQHFRIQNGFIRSFNGTMSLCSPINCDLDCTPLGTALIRAIDNCTDKVSMTLTDKGRLLIRSGDFKTFVDTTDPNTFPEYEPHGVYVTLHSPILPALRYIEPFIAVDASRSWACGVLLAGQSAFATNNVVLMEYWLSADFPTRVNVPAPAVRELLRINVEPTGVQMSDSRITFHFPEDRWLTTNVYDTEGKWADTAAILNRESNQQAFPPGFFEALERLLPFVEETDRVYFHSGRLSTSAEPDNDGTTVDLPGLTEGGCYNARQLLRLKEVASTIDFTSYPVPAMFYGDVTRGVICGVRT